MNNSSFRWCAAFLVVWLTLGIGPRSASARENPKGTGAESVELPGGTGWNFDGMALSVRLSETGPSESLVLEPFPVFSPDATVVLHSADGDKFLKPPANDYFKGHVEGRSESRVYLAVLESGEVRGFVAIEGNYWVVGGRNTSKSSDWQFESRRVEADVELGFDAAAFECGSDGLPPVSNQSASRDVEKRAAIPATKAASYTARIAVETDNEFFNKFGNATDATNYVADIIAYGSLMYSAEANTSWLLQYLSLWPQGQTDPWAQSNPGCGLYEFGRYWNDNRQAVSRTTAAFFSGKSSTSGIAWVGVLCSGGFNVNLGTSCPGLTPSIDNYGGAYAYIGGMNGNFDVNNPGVLWDIVAVTHEVGHNFNSRHTHCYSGVGGNADPVDGCYSGECGSSGCFCGTGGLPSGCPGGGQGCGTIMSYCHQLSPGMSNLSLTLGLGHPYGTEPERVPETMFSHVASQAASHSGCLDYESVDTVFEDDFELGNTNAWSEHRPLDVGWWGGTQNSKLKTQNYNAGSPRPNPNRPHFSTIPPSDPVTASAKVPA